MVSFECYKCDHPKISHNYIKVAVTAEGFCVLLKIIGKLIRARRIIDAHSSFIAHAINNTVNYTYILCTLNYRCNE